MPSQTVWVYDLYQDEWTPIEPMPRAEARGRAAVGVDRESGVIYLAGGIPSAREEALDIVSVYDTVRGQWVSLPPRARRMPAPRDHAGGLRLGESCMSLAGGMAGS